MIQKLQKKFALSEQGAKDLVKGVLSCALQNISFMFPVGILYCLVSDLLQGIHPIERFGFYVAGCVISLLLILERHISSTMLHILPHMWRAV